MADTLDAGATKRLPLAQAANGADRTASAHDVFSDCGLTPVAAAKVSRVSLKVPKTRDAFVAEGRYLSEDRSYPFAEINGVKILPIHDLNAPGRSEILKQDIVKMCQDLNIDRVMVADTLPSNGITALIKALVRSGVKVEFIDHHSGDYQNSSRHGGYQHNHKVLHSELDPGLGHRFVSTDRDDAASVAQLIPQGDLVKRQVGLYISAPPDADGIFAGIRGAGVDMSNCEEVGANTFDVVTALGRRDSPKSILSYEANREAAGRREPEWLNEFYQYHGYLKTDPERMVPGIIGMALCAKEGKLVDGKGDEVLSELRQGAEARAKAVARLVENYYDETHFADKKIFILDLTAVTSGHIAPLDQVFARKEEQAIAAELLGRGAAGLDTQELRKPIEKLMKSMNEDRCILALITAGRDGFGKSVEVLGLGAYDQKNDARTGLNFTQLGERLGRRVGGLIGHRAHVQLGGTAQEQSVNFNKLVSALAEMAKESNTRPTAKTAKFDPDTARMRARLGLDQD